MAKKEIKKEEVKSKYSGVLIKPRVTEKASYLEARSNVYAFEVSSGAGKKEIAKAVKEMYKATPLKVNIVRNPAKIISMKGKRGLSGGVKKAYVFLKMGDKLQVK